MTSRSAFRFFRSLATLMPGRVAAAVVVSLLVSATEAVVVLLLAQLLALAGVGGEPGAAGRLTRAVQAGFAAVGAAPTLGAVLALFVGLTVAQALLQRADTLLANRMEMETAHRLRLRLYRAVTGARWLPLARARGADLLAGLTGEAERSGSAAAFLLTFVVHVLLGIVYLVLALNLSAPVTGVAAACGGVLLVALHRQRSAARRAGQQLTKASAALVAEATEHLGALKVVKSYGAEARNLARFQAVAEETMGLHVRAWRAFADARAAFLGGSVLLMAVVTYVALDVVSVTAATVLLLVFIFSRLVPRLAQIQTLFQMLAQSIPAWEALMAKIHALEAEREGVAGAAPRVEVRQAVRFERVSFAYEPARGDAVRALTMEIPARRTTAVVGPSGAGKTTVADLVMGLVPPREGCVSVDGRRLDEGWLRGWREGIGYVSQETVLFNDTVLANLRWAAPDAEDDAVWEALRLAAADDFVRALPDGLGTVVGDRGVRLSGGERQRLALARALLRRPSLLILDEATSALDPENERRIRRAVAGLRGRMTILLITHRLPSVRDADLIHVLEGGRLAESGGWAELMARPGVFRRLWDSQAADDAAPLAAAESPAPEPEP